MIFNRPQSSTDWRIKRLEQKIDLILDHLGIQYEEDKTYTRLKELLSSGQKIQAIREYRQETGAGLKEAKEAVEAIERESHHPFRSR